MVVDPTVPCVVLITFGGTLVRSTFGFGEALIAVPLLAMLIPIGEAAPLAVLVSITIALLIVLQDWHMVHVGAAGRLVFFTLFGIPLGLLLLRTVSESATKAILAAIIAAFSIHRLTARKERKLEDDRFAWLFGFQAGVLGGAYGMNGPPLAIYGALRGWSPEYFRATLQAYFLPASAVGMAGYYVAGLWTPAVNRFYLFSLPGVVVASLLGRVLNRRIKATQFTSYVHVGLIAVSIVLFWQAGSRWF